MQFMLRKLLPVAAILIFIAAGCNPSEEKVVGGKPRPKEYQTVVSLSPSSTELFGAMSKFDSLKGRTAACNWPSSVLHLPIVAGVKPNYELLAKMKPDLIIYDKDLYNASDIGKLKQICPDMLVIDATNIEDFKKEIIDMASKLGGESNMSTYVDKILHAKQIALSGADAKKPKVALLMPGMGSEHMIEGVDSFQADEIRNSGGVPVGPKGSLFVSLTPETLIQLDPDFILTAGDPAGFLKDTRFANLRAVKENHVFGINQDIALRRGGRVDVFITNVGNILSGRVHG